MSCDCNGQRILPLSKECCVCSSNILFKQKRHVGVAYGEKNHWTAGMLKSELYHLIKLYKPEPQYVVADMALQHGFVVVRLPPCYCVLNPIELIWFWVKRHVAEKNTTFKIADVKSLTEEAFAAVPPDLWRSTFHHWINFSPLNQLFTTAKALSKHFG